MKVKVVDSIMGSGKTSAMINLINDTCYDEYMMHGERCTNYMYITPYLDEVARIKENCKYAYFKEPKSLQGSKINGIKSLLKDGRNIVSTHALFHLFDDEIFDLIKTKGYTLIMDEVTDVVEPYTEISKSDLKILLNQGICHVDDNNYLIWDQKDYDNGKFFTFKHLCDMNALQLFGESIVLWMFPIKSFEAFDEIYILTYMFDGQIQKWYYDFYNCEFTYYKAEKNDKGNYVVVLGTDNRRINSELLNIYEGKLNDIGERNTSLSDSWYRRAEKNSLLKDLKNNTYNYLKNIAKAKSSLTLWTVFKDFKNKCKPNSYATCWISLNLRASNEYRERNTCAYLVNRYINPVIKQFFISKDIPIDENAYALSEMLQWIWRSCIREGKPINLYVPSKRMRTLLIDWLDGKKI